MKFKKRWIGSFCLFVTSMFLPATLSEAGAIRAETAGDVAHPPALNHIYVVLDEPTYAAFRDNVALANLLGRTDGGLPDYAPPGPDSDRVFFRGRETYLEFFAPDNRFHEPVGKTGLALGYDQPARLEQLEERWRIVCGNQVRRTRVRFTRVEPAVPWFDALQCDNTAAGPQLAVWAMAYLPDFYRWQMEIETEQPPRTARADILAPRQAHGQGRFDIVGITLDVSSELYPDLLSQFQAAGLKAKAMAGATRLSGQDFEVVIKNVDGPSKLVSMELDAEESMEKLELGAAYLMPGEDGRSRLIFEES